MTWLKCSCRDPFAKKNPEALWAKDLAAMIQVTMVAYMSAGAFLGLAYFDYIYHLVAIVVVTYDLVVVESKRRMEAQATIQGPNPPRARLNASP